ncbi:MULTISPECIES: NAD-dependent epimerase/dehydratase family protein [Salinibaculum]|uniref:NAD-dependent epimerase/dehydratase family protein n=1 Tax=Salinibaculum TaxID=2732368 RepID=UPI0030CFCEC8
MDLSGQRLVVTGGAGFVGSHLAGRLVEANDVVVVDDFSNGRREWVPDGVDLVEGDLTDPDVVAETITGDVDGVFHFAAAKAVNTDRPREQFEDNLRMTHNVLERMDSVGVDHLVYTSSSTVYGEAPRPTPEDYAPLEPISEYGAGKLAEEGLISTYAHSHGLQAWVFRFANIVGPRLRGAVVPDFIEKLRDDPDELVILGDGRQQKSYMHVDECVDAMTYAVEHADDALNTYNLGTRTTTSVDRIADIVADEMGLSPEYEHTGGDRGWTGDVPRMRLSIEKLAALGWEPAQSSDDAVRQSVRDLLDEL